MKAFSSFEDFRQWLESLGMFHMELGLDRIKSALQALSVKEPPFPVIQVLGTNGKGSCASFLASLASSHGLKCGLFLSPHFVSVEERIKINGKSIPRDIWLDCANSIRASQKNGLTYFEFLTALALLIFSRLGADLAVFEAGLGGANDATSAIPPILHCFTPIAMDHAAVIGPGIADIAGDKAAAIQKGGAVFSAAQTPPVREILEAACEKAGASLYFAPPLPEAPKGGRLLGAMQNANAGLALAAWRHYAGLAGISRSEDMERLGLAAAFIPGRFQKIPQNGGMPALLLDGAHNPHAMLGLIGNMGGEKPRALIFSALADKDWQNSLALLDKACGPAPAFFPALQNSRACGARQMAAARERRFPDSARSFEGEGAFAGAFESARRLAREEGGFVLITGSLYLLAEFYKLHPQYLE